METIENNKLIAEFMGSKYINEPFKDSKGEMQDFWHWSKPDNGYPRDMNIDTAPEMSTAYMIENFSYHKSWDWLMPVVEKIANTKGFYNIENDLKDLKINSKIEDVYKSCVSFIEYTNESK